jgi:N-acetylmuramoyl-L-alanine amidase
MFQKYFLTSVFFISVISVSSTVKAQQSELFIAYPPNNHQTTAEQIFIVGSAPSKGQVLINNQLINRSFQGNFAPSFPLKMGANNFTITHNNQVINLTINRTQSLATIPQASIFIHDSLTPINNISRLPNELICFQAIALNNTQVSVNIANQNINLLPNNYQVKLPDNSAVLIGNNQAISNNNQVNYSGCTRFNNSGNLGKPVYSFTSNGKKNTQESQGTIEIINSNKLTVIKIISNAGVARTGPSTNHSRLTPLPKGTIAAVTAQEGDWLRLDYGGWIRKNETEVIPLNNPPPSIIRSVTSRQIKDETEIIFPLSMPVPIEVKEGEKSLTLSLYNLTAQTDTIKLNDDPVIKRLDWEQKEQKIDYNFQLKTEQLWGYSLRYEGTNLILSLRHPPQLNNNFQGVSILLDPGHGGNELGSVGPTGYPEKSVNLEVSLLLKQELEARGIRVYLTRETDMDVSLAQRVEMINQIKPTLALSVHYNALPDAGDALNTKGIGMFWYHPQAHNLAIFLHNYLVKNLNRPSYGVFWNNLALTRPHATPSVLMELGFMINPDEFEWITDKNEQKKLAKAIAASLVEWLPTRN